MNKNTLGKMFIFIGGVMIGSAVTWKLTKDKYQRIADEEIASVKEVYARHNEEYDESVESVMEKGAEANSSSDEDDEEMAALAKARIDYRKILRESEYSNNKTMEKKEEDTGVEDNSKYDRPYVISPEEFDELVGYRAITLKYFVDGTLMYDDDDEPVDDVEDVIGYDALDCFGEGDAVYVRDDERKIDYEVLLEMRTYAEYINSLPTSHGG